MFTMILILPPTWWRKCYDSLYFTDGETEAEFAHRQLATQVTKLWGAPNPAPVYSPVAGKDSAVCLGEDPCPRAPPPHHHILLGVSVRAGLCRPMGAAGGGAGELDPRWARVLGLQASGPLPGLQVSKYWDKGPGLEANWCRPQAALRGGGSGGGMLTETPALVPLRLTCLLEHFLQRPQSTTTPHGL